MPRTLTVTLALITMMLSGCTGHDTGDENRAGKLQDKIDVNPDLVIRQVYATAGPGPVNGPPPAVFKQDFIEIFNRGNASASLSGLSLQVSAVTVEGNAFGPMRVTALPGIALQSGQSFLIRGRTLSNSPGVDLPASPDLVDSGLSVPANGGIVALIRNNTALSCPAGGCSAANLARIVDLLGWAGPALSEGTSAPSALVGHLSLRRREHGARDTNNNSADFEPVTPTLPSVVVRQVYLAAGPPPFGAPSSTFKQHFFEIFNRGTAPASLAGWSFQTGMSIPPNVFSVQVAALPTVALQAGQSYLIHGRTVTDSPGSDLPVPPDLTTNLSPTFHQSFAAIVRTQTPLACSTWPCSPAVLASIADVVGWSDSGLNETTSHPSALFLGHVSLQRKQAGTQDTQNNSNDFIAATPAMSGNIVVRQVYRALEPVASPPPGYKNHFVELFNRGTTQVSLAGWSIQTGPAIAGVALSPLRVTPLPNIALQPGQTLLVQGQRNSASPGLLLEAAFDVSDPGMIINSIQSVAAVVRNQTAITCPASGCTQAQLGAVVDLVGWGDSGLKETTPEQASLFEGRVAIHRTGNGFGDSNNNDVDFFAGAPVLHRCSSLADNGRACSDGNACTVGDTCSNLTCIPGAAAIIDDFNPCTIDECTPSQGVVHLPKPTGSSCSDANICNGLERCNSSGQCISPSPPLLVDDGNPCTLEYCDPATGPKTLTCSTLDRSGITTITEGLSFLYTGANAIQKGVSATTIDRLRAAAIHGRILTRSTPSAALQPLPSVTLRVLDHPEYGTTVSRADGTFDLVVNGGGPLTVVYERLGYLPIQRKVTPAWSDYTVVPDAVLIAPDTARTNIDFGPSVPAQVARATASSDGDGSRRITVLFPSGTGAKLRLPNGTANDVTSLRIGASEFTVGANGPATMPAELPGGTAYTFAAELFAEEALTTGADAVEFDKSVSVYLENFLNFAVGSPIPVGFYDKKTATWNGADNGRVIRIHSINAGFAALDTDGDGSADDEAKLQALGITPEERQQLGSLYFQNDTLWRVRTMHFSTPDFNWPGTPPPNSPPPPYDDDDLPCRGDCCGAGSGPGPGDPNGNPVPGSVIQCERQVLGESIPIAGTPFNLRYHSDRAAGRTRPIRVRLAGASVNPDIRRVDVEVLVAGRKLSQSLTSVVPNQTVSIAWDKKDVFGRTVQGEQPVTVRVGYVFQTSYRAPADLGRAFGWPSSVTLATGARGDQIVWNEYKTTTGGWDAKALGLGGWTVDPHHFYDPIGRVFYGGDGAMIRTSSIPERISNLAGTGSSGIGRDGFPALGEPLASPQGIAAAADGTVYVSDTGNNRIRKISATGMVSTIAGQAGASSGNLIQNGSAELTSAGALQGWQVQGGSWFASTPGPCSNCVEPFSGNSFFHPGGNSTINQVAELWQDVSLSAFAATIDAGTQAFAFEGYVRSFNQSQGDTSRVTIEYRNASGQILSTFDSGEVASMQAWTLLSDIRTVPAGTRIARVRLRSRHRVGTDNNDGYYDALSLRAQPSILQNGSCEPIGTSTPAGWQRVSGTWTCVNPVSGFPAPGDQASYFYAGNNASAELFKDVDVSAHATSIDAGTRTFGFGALLRTLGQDGARAIVEYRRDASTAVTAVLSTYDSGERSSIDKWLHVSDFRRAPSGTRLIRVRLISIRRGTGTSNDGYFDRLWLAPITDGEGGAANAAMLNGPQGLALGPDGSLYVAETEGHRIRRIAPNGVITTVAGTGISGFSGDGGRATQAQFASPTAVAVGADNSVYVADTGNHRVRRIAPNGDIATLAGTGSAGSLGEGVLGTAADLKGPAGIAVSADGSVYIADRLNHRIRVVSPDGMIRTFAGTGVVGDGGDGGAATSALLASPRQLMLEKDVLYVADEGNHRVRRIRGSIITTVAGTSAAGGSGDGGPAQNALLSSPAATSVHPSGALLVADLGNHRIRRISSSMPGLAIGETAIPNGDGSELYIFNDRGQHLRTMNPMTGGRLFQFSYDSATGRLLSILDIDGNTTTFQYDSAGLTGIVPPFTHQPTDIQLTSDGYIDFVTDPLGKSVDLGYGASGLLTSMVDRRGFRHEYDYDASGQLEEDRNIATGGKQHLARVETGTRTTITRTTALGRTTTYEVTTGPDQSWAQSGARPRWSRRVTNPDGTLVTTTVLESGSTITSMPDGSSITTAVTSDPRFGMLSPTVTSTRRMPSGLARVESQSREATLSDPLNPLSLTSLIERTIVNGRQTTTTYDQATRTFTLTTPEQRRAFITIDAAGRPLSTQVEGLLARNFTYDRGRFATDFIGDRLTSYTYWATSDARNGYLQSTTDPLPRSPTQFMPDAFGRTLTQTSRTGNATVLGWDDHGNLSSVTPPGRPAHAQAHTAVNFIGTYTPPAISGIASTTTTWQYDADRGLTSILQPGDIPQTYTPDGAGRLDLLTFPTGSVDYQYYPLGSCTGCAPGRLSALVGPGSSRLDFTYDGSLLKSERWSGGPTGSVQWTYDNDFRVTQEVVQSGATTSTVYFGYDGDGLMTCASLIGCTPPPASSTLTATYDASTLPDTLRLGAITEEHDHNGYGELVRYVSRFNGSVIYEAIYDEPAHPRDALGRITQKTEIVGGTTTRHRYDYDSNDRLWRVHRNDTLVSEYTYDGNGNRLSLISGSTTTIGDPDAQDRLKTYGPWTYSYAANGELRTKLRTGDSVPTTYDYDARGSLLRVVLPNGTRIEYVIDGKGRRVGKRVNGGALARSYLYRNARIVAEMDASGTVSRFVYGRSHTPEYMIKSGRIYRFIKDQLGSPRIVVDVENGNIAQALEYDEFGRVLSDSNRGFQPLGFAGGLYDADTGLVRFGARDYDPELGRWTAKDPLIFRGDGANLFTYANNDPINFVDITGRAAVPLLKVCSVILARLITFALSQGLFYGPPPPRPPPDPAPNGDGGMCKQPPPPEPPAPEPNSCDPSDEF